MKNIEETNKLTSSLERTDLGILTTLIAETEISAKDSMTYEGKSLLANYVYDKGETYKLVYTVVDHEGKDKSFIEEDGILPVLFLSPDRQNYVSVVPYHPDKEMEISIPVFDRESTELPAGNRPFKGDFIGTTSSYSVFYEVDVWSKTKPDKLLAMEFRNGSIKKKHNVKVPLPRKNQVFLSDNQIHLLARDEAGWLHRQIDEKGKELKQRRINTTRTYFRQVLSLSFDTDSYLLAEEHAKINIEKIDVKGESSTIELIDFADPVFNTWRPVRIATDTYVTRFNTEFGNGWITTRKDQLLEFFYSKGINGYRNLLTEEVLEMEDDHLVISGLNETGTNSYAVVFYPMTDRQTKNRKLIVLNRKIE